LLQPKGLVWHLPPWTLTPGRVYYITETGEKTSLENNVTKGRTQLRTQKALNPFVLSFYFLLYLYILFFAILGFELRILHLLSKHSMT
jgi:hypothetical protein